MTRKLLIIGFALCLLCCRRCSSAWTIAREDSPLVAPGKAAVSESRVCYPPFLVPATEWTEEAWDAGGKIITKPSVLKAIEKHLERIGFVQQQQGLSAYVDGVQQHIAPYRFFIVSLRPTVVLMTPYDYGTTDGKSNNELSGSLNKQVLDYGQYLVNAYHYGSQVPVAPDYKWFSPTLKTPILVVPRTNGEYAVEAPGVLLTYGTDASNGWFVVRRLK